MSCGTSLSTGIEEVDCMDGVGGLLEVGLTEKRNITSITRTGQQVTAIDMASGKQFFVFAIDQEKAFMTSVMTKNVPNGTTPWVHTLQSTWRKMSVTKSNLIKILAAQPGLCALVKDNNGNYFLMGYNIGGHITTVTGQTGTAVGDANGYDWTFVANDKEDVLYVDSSIIADLYEPAS